MRNRKKLIFVAFTLLLLTSNLRAQQGVCSPKQNSTYEQLSNAFGSFMDYVSSWSLSGDEEKEELTYVELDPVVVTPRKKKSKKKTRRHNTNRGRIYDTTNGRNLRRWDTDKGTVVEERVDNAGKRYTWEYLPGL